jgi:CRISPR-associated protein Cas1
MVGLLTKLENKLVLDGNGSYLGMEKGCYVLRGKSGEIERYPLFEQEIGEVILKSGNSISTGALASFGFWDIDVLVLTQRGRPVAMLKSLDDDSHVQTRIAQYQASLDERAFTIAKSLVKAKLESQNIILRKYGLDPHLDDFKGSIERTETKNLELFRRRMTGIEGKHTQRYYQQIFGLFPEKIRPETREGFMAYDGMNNIFNLAYEILAWKVHRALIKAKLEPYLGFLHSNQMGKMSLVCDFQELYRYLIEDFLIQYCKQISKRDFVTKFEIASRRKRGKREYLSNSETKRLLDELNDFFESMIEVKRIRHGEKQTIETLINEEALIFARYLRGEIFSWSPRLSLSSSHFLRE